MTYDDDSSDVSPNSPSTVRVSSSPPFLVGDSLPSGGGVTPIGTVYRAATGVKIFDRRKMALTA